MEIDRPSGKDRPSGIDRQPCPFHGHRFTAIGIDLGETRSIDEVLAKVAERVKQTPPGDWIFGYFITHLSDRGMPTRFDIDRVSKQHPVRLTHRNGHLCSLNSKALEIFNVPKDLEGVEQVSGDITGVIRDPAIQSLSHPGLSLDEEKKHRGIEACLPIDPRKGGDHISCSGWRAEKSRGNGIPP